jgi:hypothetical protein
MEEATEMISGRISPTLHMVIYCIQAVRETIDGADEIVGTDGQFTSAADSMALKYNKYYDKLDPQLIVAHVLDPRAKLHYLREVHSSSLYSERLSADQHMNEYYQIVKEAFQLYSSTSVDNRDFSTNQQTSVPDRGTSAIKETSIFSRQFALLKKDSHNIRSSTTELDELDNYLREPIVEHGENFDVLKWWKLHSERFPTMYRMAKHFFGICASSVPSESLFSISGQILTEKRASLDEIRQHICVIGEQWLEALIRYTNVWPQAQYEFQGQYSKKGSALVAQTPEGQEASMAHDN